MIIVSQLVFIFRPQSQAELNQVFDAVKLDLIALDHCAQDRDIWIGIEHPGYSSSYLWHYTKDPTQGLIWATNDSQWLFDVPLEHSKSVGAIRYAGGHYFLCDGSNNPPSLSVKIHRNTRHQILQVRLQIFQL